MYPGLKLDWSQTEVRLKSDQGITGGYLDSIVNRKIGPAAIQVHPNVFSFKTGIIWLVNYLCRFLLNHIPGYGT